MSGDSSLKEKVTEIFGEMIVGSMKYAWKQINYVRKLDENMESLKSKMNDLRSRDEDIEMAVNKEEVIHGKKRKREVEIWQKNVKKIEKEVKGIEENFGEGTRSFIHLRNLWPNFNLGTLVAKKIKEVDELCKKCSFSNGLTGDRSLESGMILPRATPLVGVTAGNTQNLILECLGDENIGKIGVHGLGGSGKTAIMKNINNILQKSDDFKYIIWVTVSKASNLKRLQSDVAKKVELELPEDDYEDSRSMKLYNALMRRKKFVLILDDVSVGFPLEMIGIPEPDKENGCKIVVTTRLLNVCGCMETQKDIHVELLSDDEAWELFKKKVDANVMQSPEIQAIAKQVVNECRRLPLAIVTVGRALSKVEDVRVWRNALNKMKCSSMEDLQEGILL